MLNLIIDIFNFVKKPNMTTFKLLIISVVSLIDLATDFFVASGLLNRYCSGDVQNDDVFSEACTVIGICTIHNEIWFFLILSCALEFAKAMMKINIMNLSHSPTFYLSFKSVFGLLFITGEDIPQVILLFRIQKL